MILSPAGGGRFRPSQTQSKQPSEQTARLDLTSDIQLAQPNVHQCVKISTHDLECSSFSGKYLLSWQSSAAIEYHVLPTWTSS